MNFTKSTKNHVRRFSKGRGGRFRANLTAAKGAMGKKKRRGMVLPSETASTIIRDLESSFSTASSLGSAKTTTGEIAENRFAAFVDCELASSGLGLIAPVSNERVRMDNSALAGVPWELFEELPAEDENHGPRLQQKHKPAEKAEKAQRKEEEVVDRTDAEVVCSLNEKIDTDASGSAKDWFTYLGLNE